MLKAANMGDKDALWYVGSSHLKSMSTTKLFVEEALGSKYWDLSKRKNNEFSNSYDLYYRLKKMYNKDERWIEDYDKKDKIWDDTKTIIEKFDKGASSLIFEDKKIVFKSTLSKVNQDRVLSEDLELVYKIMCIDLSGAKKLKNLHSIVIAKIKMQQSFEFSKKFSLYGYKFIWYSKYDIKTKKIIVEIRIDNDKKIKN